MVGTAQAQLHQILLEASFTSIAKINKVRVECDHLKVVQTALSRIADFIKKQWEVKVVHISPDINKFTVFCREFKALSWCNFHNHRP
ncbi:hypothetical protein V6N11_073641 [Hibiscus sabdariffa]|uniref:RNase H type-1 domain-containing protein n=1 Tax=Hibiscus sabdariffa TaxID=183260 RepID=A0ABR2NU89_9ROSI